ncbi:MAG: hypothetical protein ACREBH_00190 [Candidatus Micrarchaeaceae archaeon]
MMMKPRAQTAMEYLATYSWAIVIIMIVIIALFYLGIFNGSSIQPRAPPGECSIYRPGGTGSITTLDLVGVCDGELPEFIFHSQGIGDFEVISTPTGSRNPVNISNNVTISAWVYLYGAPYHDVVVKEAQYGMKINYNNAPHQCSPSNNAGLCLEWDTANSWVGDSFPIPGGGFDQWIFLTVSVKDGEYKYWYANGQLIGSQTVTSYQPESSGACGKYATAVPLTIAGDGGIIGNTLWGDAGCYPGYGYDEWFNGIITNVQLYNTSLSSNNVAQLYKEGIAGAPISLKNLVGWWPLNGNGDDYSGEGDNGATYNGFYVGSWDTNYSAP